MTSRSRCCAPLPAVGLALLGCTPFWAAAKAPKAPAVAKTVVKSLPTKGLFRAAAVQGKIYAFKFVDDDMTTSEEVAAGGDMYAYDASTDRWEARTKMPVKRSSYSLVVVNDRIYVIGGFTAANEATGSVEEYDPATDAWATRAGMPTARSRAGIVVLDGKIYALGGKVKEGAATDAVECYDPVRDTWSRKRALSRTFIGVHAAAAGGKIYVLKGTELKGKRFEMVLDFDEYNPATDTWTRKASGMFPKEPLEAVAAGGRYFAVGGGAFTNSSVPSLKEYEPAGDRWVARSNMLSTSARTIHFSWAVLDGKIYTFGGGYRVGDGWRASNHAQRYDPGANAWEELPPLAENKIGMATAVAGNRIFVLGGEKMGATGDSRQNAFSDMVEVYEVGGEGR